MKLEFSQRI